MNMPLGRNGLIGLAVGATAGCGLIAFIIYKEIVRRRSQRLVLEARPASRLLDGVEKAVQPRDAMDAQEVEAQQQALAAVEAVVQGLSPEQQLEFRNQLDEVLTCVGTLRLEVAELRGGLQDIAQQIIQDVKKGVEDTQRVRRRRHFVHRERTDSTSSSSIYFTASQGAASTYETTSEGGYSTAYAESDYTDRDTDKEEGGREPEEESEEDEERSCATVLTIRQEDSQEEVEERGLEDEDEEEEEDEGRLQLYGDSREFLWRLARAYRDMYESTEDKQEKKAYAQQDLEKSIGLAELALKKNGLNAECHKWFAVLTELTSQHDSMHSKLKSSHILKVATLDWLEKKAAAALYQSPPTSTLHDALENFLKAEELSPGFSKTVRLYIAQCHRKLGNISEATNWTELALKMPTNSNYDETSKLEAQLRVLTDTKT
ncbi:hypothetical protein FQN60_015961 [Etheostoma spectabile]|uniref:Regulator of microtubule dynamics protein 3 n=1 Tax=Etheostoma spectabile TaxID=54343 RepID=A0A5J5CS89_9PERO|nr:hypothetical protein FQN60_015961 [Etheostoma spectabile]